MNWIFKIGVSGSEKERITSNVGITILTYVVILCFLILFLRAQKEEDLD